MARVVLFPTCVVDTVAADVGAAVVAVLRGRGFDVVVPRDATCCGQPAWNAGYAAEAAQVAATTLAALRSEDGVVCVPAGSCATMIRRYWPTLFATTGAGDAAAEAEELTSRVREFSELLASTTEEGVPGTGGGGGGRGARPDPSRSVAYHHSCHMLRELGIETPPEDLLGAAGIDVTPWSGARRCCGFGGTFAVKQPETSTAMADDKLDDLTHVDELVGCDTSCLLHLRSRAERRGLGLKVRHLAEVLAAEEGAEEEEQEGRAP